MGNDILKDLEEYLNKKDDIKKLALEITEGLTTPNEQSRALHKYVASQFETSDDYYNWYFVHKNVGEMLTEKRGSAEAMNLLLVEMHEALGITAWPILISTRDHGRLDPGNPDLRQFNHLLAYIEFPDDWKILDASNEIIPYGVLPPNCLVDGALLLKKDECTLIKLPEMPRPSERTDHTRMIIDEEGLASCSTSCKFTGYYATQYGQLYKKKTPEEFVKDHLTDRLGITYTLGSYNCALDTCDEFIASLDFSSDELAQQLDDNLVVAPVCYAFRANPFKSEKRFFPVDFMYPFVYRNIVELFLPEGAGNYQLPEDKNINIEGAVFSRVAKVNDSCVTITSTLNVEQPVFAQYNYGELREFFEALTLCSKDEFLCSLNNGK